MTGFGHAFYISVFLERITTAFGKVTMKERTRTQPDEMQYANKTEDNDGFHRHRFSTAKGAANAAVVCFSIFFDRCLMPFIFMRRNAFWMVMTPVMILLFYPIVMRRTAFCTIMTPAIKKMQSFLVERLVAML